MKNLSILGVTGSIGTQTLEVLRKEKETFNLVGVSFNRNYEMAIKIIDEFSPKYIAITDNESYNIIKKYTEDKNINAEVLFGMEGLKTIATLEEIDIVVTSVVGMIGLIPTLAAIKAGKDIALANKETLVVAGEIVMKEAKENNVKILPVDSEHSAIFQCLQGNHLNTLHKIILTASGGPFRGKSIDQLKEVRKEQALRHPNWNMGNKISIDSATLMNKGLEVIEAHWLFDVCYNDINVVVHPQSIIHSAVQYTDGSVIAQLGNPDMRLPIQYALNYPNRKQRLVEELDFFKISDLTFEKPDYEVFRCLSLAFEAGNKGGLMPTVLNGANEVCVELFLKDKIKFLDVPKIIEKSMEKFDINTDLTIDNILKTDKEVRKYIYTMHR